MNKHLNIKLLAATLVMFAGLTSCDDNNDDPDKTIIESTISPCYAVVTDLQTANGQTVSHPVTLKCWTNWTDAKLNFTISGIQIGASNLPVLAFEGLPISQDSDKWLYCEADRLQTTGNSITSYSLTDFELRYLDRFDLMDALKAYYPACSFEFIVDGRYKVVGANQPFVMGGKTSSAPTNGATFTTEVPMYSVTLDIAKRTAKIAINKAQFSAQMPLLNIEFPDIPFTFGEDGKNIIMHCESLTPTFAGTPNSDTPISNLNGILETDEGLELIFTCNFKGTTYNVKADLKFSEYKSALGA